MGEGVGVQAILRTLIGLIMALWLARLNGRGLSSESRRTRLARYLQRPGVDAYYLQKTWFSTRGHEDILSKRSVLFFQLVLKDAFFLGGEQVCDSGMCSSFHRSGVLALRAEYYHKKYGSSSQ